MATNSDWTVVFEDKLIIKQNGDGVGPHKINDDSFWNDSKFSNIWAIQYTADDDTDQVEYRDTTPNSTYDSSVLGDIQQFIDKWDAEHLNFLQEQWDSDSRDESEKGPRPTSYSS
jgi:hypothetical protein